MKTLIILVSLFFSACSVKEYKLFQTENANHIQSIKNIDIHYESKIMIDDVLIIDIYNMNKKANILMSNMTQSLNTIEINEYIVSEDGEIFLPLLSNVKVVGLTLKELNILLNKKYKKFLNSPHIKSKIKNHKIYVLGEVLSQGIVPIPGNSISIIEVISKSGGLSNHALRDKIRIISENHGKFQIRTLDLTKFSTLNTHNLMVRNNSIVYIEPKQTKAIKVAIDDYAPILNAVSTVLSSFLTIDYLRGQ